MNKKSYLNAVLYKQASAKHDMVSIGLADFPTFGIGQTVGNSYYRSRKNNKRK